MTTRTNNQRIKVIRRSQIKEIAKIVLSDIENLKDKEQKGGFKFNDYNILSLKEQYKFYAHIHNINRTKAKTALDTYKELSNDVLNRVMFDDCEFIMPKFSDNSIKWDFKAREANLLKMSERIKTTIDMMELVYNSELCID